jgi:Mce-associated membrane protein
VTSTPRPPDRRSTRPVVGSRNPTGRPRQVAGRPPGQPDGGVEVEAPPEPEPGPAPAPPPRDEHPEPAPSQEPVAGPPARRSTLVLVVAIVLLVGIAAAEGWYLWLREDPVVSAARPVVTGEVSHRSAVDAASKATDEIFSTSYKNYDEQVDDAVSKMVDNNFADEYRQTAEDSRDGILDEKVEIQVEVAAASVVRADESQVQALLFLNQYVTKGGEDTSYTPYRALVTVVNTDQGWLVSDIETK